MATKRGRDEEGVQLSSDDIRTIVYDIRSGCGTDKKKIDLYSKKYPEFAENYPHLFHLACEPKFDMAQLNYMLALRDSINNNERTFEDASKEVGEVMFDKYIKDKVQNMKTPPQ